MTGNGEIAALQAEIDAYVAEAGRVQRTIREREAEVASARSEFDAILETIAGLAENAGLPVKSILSTLGLVPSARLRHDVPNNRSRHMPMNKAQAIRAMEEAATDGAAAAEQIKTLAEQREELVAKLAEIDAAIAAEADAAAAAATEGAAAAEVVADPATPAA